MGKRIIGLILVFASLGALGLWEFWGRETLTYTRILTLREDVQRGTVITADMLAVERVEHPAEGVLPADAAESLVQQQAVQYIPKDTPLYEAYFQEPALVTGGDSGRYVLSIPDGWLLSCPQTMRRGDQVSFYCDGSLVVTATVAYARDRSNQEVVSADGARLAASAPVSMVEVVVDEEQALTLGRLADEGKRFVLLYC